MGFKRFDTLADFWRHGQHLYLTCRNGHCDHHGVIDAYEAWHWFKLHRWPDAIEGGALRHFRCIRCGSKAGHAAPTENAVTVTTFFPADERGWKMLKRRLRG